MEQNSLITGSRTVINVRKLGYKSYHVFIEAHTPEEEKMLLQRANKTECVNAIILYSGKYNLEVSIMAKNEEEFLVHYAGLVNNIRLREDQVLVLMDTVTAKVLPDKYLKTKEKKENYNHAGKDKDLAYLPDATDLELLNQLSQNATQTNLSLAEKFGLSKDTVKYRIKQLENSHYILEYRPVINYSALGLSINSVLIKLNYNEAEIKAFELFLKEEDSVLWCVRTFGYFDYLVYAITSSLDDFHGFINKIKHKFSGIIKTYEVLFAYEEMKYEFMARSIVKEKELLMKHKKC
jgi:DNA-binding Lrp family transcriptional regulator